MSFPDIGYGNRLFGKLSVNSRQSKIIFNQAHDGYGSFQSSAGTYHVHCGVKSYEEIIQYEGRGHNIQQYFKFHRVMLQPHTEPFTTSLYKHLSNSVSL